MNKLVKSLFIVCFVLLTAFQTRSQGWEQNYGGVMLQGFYWDSFDDTKWTNLTSQADELSAYFNLIWIPNSGSSGYYSMGYSPQYWFKHDSSFGTSDELRNMIRTFKNKGTGFIADVVVNHRNGVTNWYDFPIETDHKGNTWELGLWAICGNDEMAYADGQPTPTGAYDEGENFDGCRDLDHTNTYVQDAIKAYLDYLINELGYTGFRYDMVKGFAAYYVGLYNAAVNPKYSVGEYFDSNYDLVTSWINGTSRDGNIQSGAFDFCLKYAMNEAFAPYSDAFNKLSWLNLDSNTNQPAGLIHHDNYKRYAVTFVDNHDTYRDGSKFTNDSYIEAANAYILCHPGTPCVFLPHWQSHKEAIKRLIDIRKSVGIHNQSGVEVWSVTNSYYAAKIYGFNGDLFIKVGYGDYSPGGYTSADIVASGEGYCVWTKCSISDSSEKLIPKNDRNGISVYIKKSSIPSDWSDLYCYGWSDEDERLTSVFPGEKISKTVVVGNNEYYKYSFDSSAESVNIVLSDGNESQTVDLENISADIYYEFSSTNSSGKYIMTELSVSGTETGTPITIYLDKNSVPESWGDVYYYIWDKENNALSDSWPGTKVSDIETLNGVEYYKYTLPDTITLANCIFTDGSTQSEDILGIIQTGYYRMTEMIDGKYDTEKINASDGQGIAVYLEKNQITDIWGNIYYYAWNEDLNPMTEYWPGTEVLETETVNGVEYYKYIFDSSISSLNIIFSNGSQQTADIENIDRDMYYSLKSFNGDVERVDPDTYTGDESKPISIYLKAKSVSAWSKVNYYAWNEDELLGSWPGTQITTKETICGEEFYVYTFPEDVKLVNIIFNNGSGQTANIENITTTTYFSMNEDFSYSMGTESIKIYLDKNSASAWSKVNYYAWDNADNPILDSWPGYTVTDTELAQDGNEYYCYVFDPSISSLNIIFNDGTNQTKDINGITETTFFKLNSTSGKSITTTTVLTDIITEIEAVKMDSHIHRAFVNSESTELIVSPDKDKIKSVKIFNPGGSQLIVKKDNRVDISQLPRGLYIYTIEFSDTSRESGKFIKK